MRLVRYLLGFYAGFLLTMLPVALCIGAMFLLDVWLPFGVAAGIAVFGIITYTGVDQYRRDKARGERLRRAVEERAAEPRKAP